MVCVLFFLSVNSSPCPKVEGAHKRDQQKCWMDYLIQETLRLRVGQIPFLSFYVNDEIDEIACYGGLSTGPNSDKLSLSKLGNGFHTEEAATLNCTFMYPSPTGNQRTNPGWKMINHTLYTTAVPCAMGCAHAMFERIGGLVYGTNETTLLKLGLSQFVVTCPTLLDTFVGPNGTKPVPLPPNVLIIRQEETDEMFQQWRAANPL